MAVSHRNLTFIVIGAVVAAGAAGGLLGYEFAGGNPDIPARDRPDPRAPGEVERLRRQVAELRQANHELRSAVEAPSASATGDASAAALRERLDRLQKERQQLAAALADAQQALKALKAATNNRNEALANVQDVSTKRLAEMQDQAARLQALSAEHEKRSADFRAQRDALKAENAALKDQMARLQAQMQKLRAENEALKRRVP